MKLWAFVSKRTLAKEHTLHSKDFAKSRIVELLGETNPHGTVSKLPPFVSRIILEFYVNLSKDIRNPARLNFQKTIVRGHTFDFSSSIINQYWECTDVREEEEEEEEVPEIDPMVSVIAGGKVRSWPYKF